MVAAHQARDFFNTGADPAKQIPAYNTQIGPGLAGEASGGIRHYQAPWV
jgi:hypothetical protein